MLERKGKFVGKENGKWVEKRGEGSRIERTSTRKRRLMVAVKLSTCNMNGECDDDDDDDDDDDNNDDDDDDDDACMQHLDDLLQLRMKLHVQIMTGSHL